MDVKDGKRNEVLGKNHGNIGTACLIGSTGHYLRDLRQTRHQPPTRYHRLPSTCISHASYSLSELVICHEFSYFNFRVRNIVHRRLNIFHRLGLTRASLAILLLQQSKNLCQRDHRHTQNRNVNEPWLEAGRTGCPPDCSCIPDGHDVAKHVRCRDDETHDRGQ